MNFKMSEETVLSIDPWGTCGSHSGLPSRVDRWWPALEHLVTVGPVQSGAPFWTGFYSSTRRTTYRNSHKGAL